MPAQLDGGGLLLLEEEEIDTTGAVFLEHEPLWSFYGENRHLAAELPDIDFTVLSMAVVTLSMLMIVAVLRHNIDKIAKGKDIFENVLEAVYHECK